MTSLAELISSKNLKERQIEAILDNVFLPEEYTAWLEKQTGRKNCRWLTTSGAVTYCLLKSKRNLKEWHSILAENRREQNDLQPVIGPSKQPKGNVKQYGWLPFHRIGNNIFYTEQDLDCWLEAVLHSWECDPDCGYDSRMMKIFEEFEDNAA